MLGPEHGTELALGRAAGSSVGLARGERPEVDLGKGRQASVNQVLNQCSQILGQWQAREGLAGCVLVYILGRSSRNCMEGTVLESWH